MPAPFPHRYNAEITWTSGRRGTLLAPPRPSIVGDAPPEFDGPPDHWSPEHLLLSALNLCLMQTYLAIAEKARVGLRSYRARAEGIVDKTDTGLAVTAVAIRMALRVDGADVAKAEELVQKAKKYCIVSNSVKADVTVTADITPA
ncbi:MAG: OsmC family protein [Planctomycetes bacterium]|nr:OsmC family protein [Planctomycetota bacterium]MBI3845574.1 OsmC family protein [Planctomycetota bacterium]